MHKHTTAIGYLSEIILKSILTRNFDLFHDMREKEIQKYVVKFVRPFFPLWLFVFMKQTFQMDIENHNNNQKKPCRIFQSCVQF